jgi:hypothetical protein
MIVGMLKSEMGFTYNQLLYDISFQNLILLSSAIPSYDFDRGKSKNKGNNKTSHQRNAGGLKGLFATLQGK